MKIFFTISAEQFANISDSHYELDDCNFLNLGTSSSNCIRAFEESRASGVFTEKEYDEVYVCSGEADDEQVINCLWVAVDGAGHYPLKVTVDESFNTYRCQTFKKAS